MGRVDPFWGQRGELPGALASMRPSSSSWFTSCKAVITHAACWAGCRHACSSPLAHSHPTGVWGSKDHDREPHSPAAAPQLLPITITTYLQLHCLLTLLTRTPSPKPGAVQTGSGSGDGCRSGGRCLAHAASVRLRQRLGAAWGAACAHAPTSLHACSPISHGAGARLRLLAGFLQLLSQLTTVGDISPDSFKGQCTHVLGGTHAGTEARSTPAGPASLPRQPRHACPPALARLDPRQRPPPLLPCTTADQLAAMDGSSHYCVVVAEGEPCTSG